MPPDEPAAPDPGASSGSPFPPPPCVALELMFPPQAPTHVHIAMNPRRANGVVIRIADSSAAGARLDAEEIRSQAFSFLRRRPGRRGPQLDAKMMNKRCVRAR